MNKISLIKDLNLKQHIEGGYFARTYESDKYIDDHELLTSIYYMLTNDSPVGHFHKNKSDIVHYFHLGSPIKYLTISPDGVLDTFTLGHNVSIGNKLQMTVHGGYWKASFLEIGEFGLISEAVSPGFNYQDMTIAEPQLMRSQLSHVWDKISLYVKTTSI